MRNGTKINWYPVKDGYFPENNERVLITHVNSAGKHVSEATYKDYSFFYIAETPTQTYEEKFGIVLAWCTIPQAY